MRYGLPYQGSKNKLAARIVDLLPAAEHLYDVFAGGCAVSHAALLSGKFGCVHFSDTNDVVALFRDVLEGNIPDGSEWISREEFYRRKDSDPYVRVVWSFGNNQRDYLYSREIEPYKKAVHEMIFASTPNERRLKFKEVCRLLPQVIGGGTGRPTTRQRNAPRGCLQTSISGGDYPHCREQPAVCKARCRASECAYRLEPLERMGGEIAVRRTERWLEHPFCDGEYEMRVADYRDIEILPNSVIYCDIPYKGTAGYGNGHFDYEAFYDWCLQQTQPVYISEYWMPEDRFECVAEFGRTSTFSSANNGLKVTEKVFKPKLK